MYFGVCNDSGSGFINKHIKSLCGGDVSGYPYGMFYADAQFNEYFERPGEN